MKYLKLKTLALITFVALSLFSCKNDDDTIVEPPQVSEIQHLATFHGDLASEIVIINTQGGPVTTLEDETLNEFINGTGTQNVLWVNVHQAQTANPGTFTQTDITFDQAKEFDKQSITWLKTVVDFFKQDPDRKVYVLGISFGAFMTQELIAQHGIDVADGYLIMVGRLNIDDAFWMGFSEGQTGGYTYDAEGNASFILADQESVEERNMSRLAAGLGHNRYTTEFANIPDLSKITYVTGTRDEQVGVLTLEEGQFLQGKGASVNVVPDATHGEAIDAGLMELLRSTFDIEQ